MRPGFITEVLTQDWRPVKTAQTDAYVNESAVMRHLASGFSTRRKDWEAPSSGVSTAREAQSNSILVEIHQKELLLTSLQLTLSQLTKEGEPTELDENYAVLAQEHTEMVDVMCVLFSNKLTKESGQYEYMLQRIRTTNLARKDQVKRLQRELLEVNELHNAVWDEFKSIEKSANERVRELELANKYTTRVQTSYEASRGLMMQELETQHTKLDEELTKAKHDKAVELNSQGNVQRLKEWLFRQREARKIMRLYIGLEEFGTLKLNGILSSITKGLGGHSIDDALVRYQATTARNKSLVQEAEYKLTLQANYELRFAALVSELRWIQQDLELRDPWSMQIRGEKVDIYHPTEIRKAKQAELEFADILKRNSQREVEVSQMVSQLWNLLALLQDVDPVNMYSVRIDSLASKEDIVLSFLVLEKKLKFLLDLTEQRKTCSQKPKGKNVVEALKFLLMKGAKNKYGGDQVRKVNEVYQSHFTSLAQDHQSKVKSDAQALIRSATAVEQNMAKAAQLTKTVSSINLSEDASPKSKRMLTRVPTLELPKLIQPAELTQTFRIPTSIPSKRELQKQCATLKRKNHQLQLEPKSQRITDFIFNLRQSEQRLVEITKGRLTCVGFRTPPLKLTGAMSPRSIGSTRADTGISLGSQKGMRWGRIAGLVGTRNTVS